MDKSTLLLAAIILAVFGASTAAGHPHWGTFTGIAIILLAAGLAAGTLPLRSQDFVEERTSPTQRISNGLITLSSAAIVAIYAAGYHRTSPAAHRFDSQIPQQRTSATIAIATPPPAASAGAAAAPPVSSSAAPAIKKNTKKPSTPSRKAAPSTEAIQRGHPHHRPLHHRRRQRLIRPPKRPHRLRSRRLPRQRRARIKTASTWDGAAAGMAISKHPLRSRTARSLSSRSRNASRATPAVGSRQKFRAADCPTCPHR